MWIPIQDVDPPLDREIYIVTVKRAMVVKTDTRCDIWTLHGDDYLISWFLPEDKLIENIIGFDPSEPSPQP